MKVYKLSEAKIIAYLHRQETAEEGLVLNLYAPKELRFRRADLKGYGLNEEEVDYLISKNFLEEQEVPGNVAIGIARYHRIRQDPSHRAKLLANLQKSALDRETRKLMEQKYGNLKKQWKKDQRRLKRRRSALMKRVLKPEFGRMNGDGTYEISSIIAPMDVTIMIKEKYPFIARLYPSHINEAVRTDLKRLGFDTNSKGDSFKRMYARMNSNPIEAEKIKRRVSEMIKARKQIYQKDPARKIAAQKASLDARRKKQVTQTVYYFGQSSF